MYQLLGSPASPYVRKVRALIREAGATDQVQEVMVSTSPMASAAEVLTANPLGKIPVLIRPEGPSIYDSRVIYITLEGGLGVLAAFGDDGNFVVTVGGFHPSYNPPALPFPDIPRIAINILRDWNMIEQYLPKRIGIRELPRK